MIAKTLLTALFLPIALMFSDGDKGIAFEIFQKIPKLDLQECFRGKQYTCPDDCTRHFESDYESDADDIFSYAFEVNCLPANDGGWVAVLVNERCFDGCIQETKTYRYKDGVLKEIPDVLPHLSVDELLEEGLITFEMGGLGKEAMDNGYEERELFGMDGNRLSFVMECDAYDGGIMVSSLPKWFVWNGEAFVESQTTPDLAFFELRGLVKRCDEVEFDQWGSIVSMKGYNPFDRELYEKRFENEDFMGIELWTRNDEGYVVSIMYWEGLEDIIWGDGRVDSIVGTAEGTDYVIQYSYDQEGRLIQAVERGTSPDDETDMSNCAVTKYEYLEFDDHGNWTRRKEKRTEAEYEYEKEINRVIEYY